MFEEKSQQLNRLMTLLDMVLTAAAFVTAYVFRETLSQWMPHLYDSVGSEFFTYLGLLPIILVSFGFSLSYYGAYRGPRTETIISYFKAVFIAVAFSISLLLSLLFLMKIKEVSRAIILLFAFLDVVFLMAFRIWILGYFKRCSRRGDKSLKVLIIGTGERAIRLSHMLSDRLDWGAEIIGHLDPDRALVGSRVNGSNVIGSVEDIHSILKDHVVDEVILAIPRTMISDVQEIALACEEEGVRLRLMADVFDLEVSRMQLVNLGDIPLLTLEPVAQDELKLLVKRVFDLVVCLSLMPAVLPIMAIIAAAIKFDSPGPVFFIQQRVGFRKRIFPMLKFRSMHNGSEHLIKELEHLNEAKGPIFKMANDPRTTRFGKFLRKSSMDELPQIFNVIRGEMSLVGPRPMSLRDVNLFDKGVQRKRFSVKPGLTCLWQISGRSNLPFSKWLELDLTYIKEWSLSLDLKILLKTIPAVLRGCGAL